MTRRLFRVSFPLSIPGQARRIALCVAATASIVLGLAMVQPGQAATFTCVAGDVQCLIIAINHANSNGQPQNTILLEAGTYTLTNVDNDTDGPNGLPSITSTLSITGAGAGLTVITRASAVLPFRLMHVSSSGDLTLRGLTLSGGLIGFLDASGGALFNDGGSVRIVQTEISGNLAADGAGLFNNSGTVRLQQSMVLSNHVPGCCGAGGLSNRGHGDVTIEETTFAQNGESFGDGAAVVTEGTMEITRSQFTEPPGAFGAGAIHVLGGTAHVTKTTFLRNAADATGAIHLSSGSLTIRDSAFVGNVIPTKGSAAAISVSNLQGSGAPGTLEITNTTFAQNKGGFLPGFVITNVDGTAVITNSTLADNTTWGSIVPISSGVIASGFNATTILQNTIVARNIDGNGMIASDCNGAVASGGNNIIGNPVGCAIDLQPSDLTGDPGLGTFTDNGTPGNGHLPLLPTSQAINAANDNVCPIKDQIGRPRKPHL